MKNLKVSMKLVVGFGITILFLVTVGVISVSGLRSLNSEYVHAVDEHGKPLGNAADILASIHSLRAELRLTVLNTGKQENLKNVEVLINNWCKKYEENAEEFATHVFQEENKLLLAESKEAFAKFKSALMEILSRAKKGEDQGELMKFMLANALPNATKVAENMTQVIENKKIRLDEAEHKGEAFSGRLVTTMIIVILSSVVAAVLLCVYIAGLISKPLGATVNMITEIGRGHLDARLRLDRADEIGEMAKAMDAFADDMQNNVIGAMKKISVGDLSVRIELKDSRDEISGALKGTVDALRALIIDDGGKVLLAAANKDLSHRLAGDYKGDYAKMKENINTVVESLDDALCQVAEAVAQVTSASAEISNGAQHLAEGSNDQASSLEEVSSSLEEMSSMTKQNADNSNQAKILASEARGAANEGDSSMNRMADAIREIKASSDNTAKIIKTIDDIAFQTNLLALNAAVEAARAGEAGKGFAVVAEEVRNLAMRSADAAKNTANMIEESVKKADGGVKITEEVAKSLGQIVDRISKVGDLIAEIAAASNEQAQGIEQVNTAVARMNQVTQENASNSEESASAAEELSGQAAELSKMVSAFKLSDGGGYSGGYGGGYRPAQNARRPAPAPQRARAALPDKSGHKGTKSMKSVRAEEIIPLDDEELNDF